jgi:hypothetical protein
MPHRKNISVKCEVCKNNFFTSLYAIKKGRKFCSNQCSFNYRKKEGSLVDTVCKNCHKNFKARQDHLTIGWGRFCSNSCKNSGIFNPLFHKKGNLNPNWKGGIVPLKRRLRTNYIYRAWRLTIFQRDNYTCQDCGKRGSYLEAHHKESWNNIFNKNIIKTFEDAIHCNELWSINNGITLCKNCHKKYKHI